MENRDNREGTILVHMSTRIFRPYPYPPYNVQPLKYNNKSARAAEQRENIHNMCCFIRQTLSALAAK